MRNIRVILAYDGTDFHGWQVQPGLRTVQQTFTDAIERVTSERVLVHGSGRTDAGVHALGQVANFVISAALPIENFARALNAVLPRSVRVLRAELASSDFHARRDAVCKSYSYRIFRGEVCPPFLRNYTYHFPYKLNEPSMIAAAPVFEGEHDFRSFAASADPSHDYGASASYVRTVYASRLLQESNELVYWIKGNGFLHHMVRNIVGFLIDIGCGLKRVDDVGPLFGARQRSAAGRMAPARGLYLECVSYSDAPRA